MSGENFNCDVNYYYIKIKYLVFKEIDNGFQGDNCVYIGSYCKSGGVFAVLLVNRVGQLVKE